MPHPAVAGRWAEQRALRLLRQQGWQLLARNWHCRWGELDLLLAKPGRLLLVEVKGRSAGSRDGAGIAALRAPKRSRLERAWCCWLAQHPQHAGARLEVVAALVSLPPLRRAVRWIPLSDWGSPRRSPVDYQSGGRHR
jgi:putative endonuclease